MANQDRPPIGRKFRIKGTVYVYDPISKKMVERKDPNEIPREVLKFENGRCVNAYRIRKGSSDPYEIWFNDWHRRGYHGGGWRHISYTDKETYGISGNAQTMNEAIDLATMHSTKLGLMKYLPTETTFREPMSNDSFRSYGAAGMSLISSVIGSVIGSIL